MSYTIQKSDTEILRNAGVSEGDNKHCMKVAEKALKIARRTGAHPDMEIVGRGALFHYHLEIQDLLHG
jgi:HD superfamily phosphodiesterase